MSIAAPESTDTFTQLRDFEEQMMHLRMDVALLHCAHVGLRAISAADAEDKAPVPEIISEYATAAVDKWVDDINERAERINDMVCDALRSNGGAR
jgi:hypothetical protein